MKMRIELLIIMFVAAFALPIHATTNERVTVFPQLGHTARSLFYWPSASFSPNGQYLLSSDSVGSVQLWDVASGREIRTMMIATDGVRRVSWSSDGRHALFLGLENRDYDQFENIDTITIWDVFGAQEVLHIAPAPSRLFTFATYDPLSQYVLYADDLATLHLYDITKGTDRWCSVQTKGKIKSAAFTPDGNKIVTLSHTYPEKDVIMLWNAANGSLLSAQDSKCGYSDSLDAIVISPNGRYSVKSGNQAFLLWDMTNASQVLSFKHDSQATCVLSFSPDSQYLLFGGDSSSAMWDVPTRNLVWSAADSSGYLTNVFDMITAVSPDWQHYVAKTRSGELKLMNMATHENIRSFGANTRLPSLIKPSLGADPVFVRYDDGDIGVWNSLAGVLQSHYVFHAGIIYDSITESILRLLGLDTCLLAFSTSGRYLTASSYFFPGKKAGKRSEQYLIVEFETWDMATGKQIRKSPSLTNSYYALSRDSQYAVALGEDGMVFWDSRAGQALHFKSLVGTSIPVDISPNANYSLLFKCDLDGWNYPPTLIDLRNGSQTGDFSSVEAFPIMREVYEDDPVFAETSSTSHAYLVSPEGSYGLAGEEKKLNEINDLMGGVLVKMKGGADIRGPLAFSKDQRLVVSRRGKDRLELWERESGRSVTTFATRADVLSSVALTADDSRCITAGKDGATRVFSTETGQELASMYLFRDNEWITITPEGYYNSSPNGDKYLNVRIGNRVYGVENFRDTFYRPDLVKLALAGGSLERKRRIEKINEAPIVSIVACATVVTGSETQVAVMVEDVGGGVGDIALSVNESTVVREKARGASGVRGIVLTNQFTVSLASGTNTLRVVGYNSDGSMFSAEATRQIIALYKKRSKPALHAVVVGINEYRAGIPGLSNCVADAELFANTLRRGAGSLFYSINIVMLTNKAGTTQARIANALGRSEGVQADDLFVFYVAAHGMLVDGEYFLLPSDVSSLRPERLRQEALTQEQLKQLLSNIPATKKVIVLDVCQAEQLGLELQLAFLDKTRHRGGMDDVGAARRLSKAVGSAVYTACAATQQAAEGYEGHGVFTYVLAKGLGGEADADKDGYVLTSELVTYVDAQVEKIAASMPNATDSVEQTSMNYTSQMAFPVAKVNQSEDER